MEVKSIQNIEVVVFAVDVRRVAAAALNKIPGLRLQGVGACVNDQNHIQEAVEEAAGLLSEL